jgi:transaldolase
VEAFAGSDIQTNPPATNQAIAESGREFTRQVDQLPTQEILDDIDGKVDFQRLEEVLMEEGIRKFADPHKALIALIAEKRSTLQSTG